MIEYFKKKFYKNPEKLKLSRDNYLPPEWRGVTEGRYPENCNYCKEYCYLQVQKVLLNFDYNIARYSSLSHEEFNKELNRILLGFPRDLRHIIRKETLGQEVVINGKLSNFRRIDNLNKLKNYWGLYILVLDEYCQMYIGISQDIHRRILQHWEKRKPFERLILGNYRNSTLSVDSFCALDTTRIYVLPLFDPGIVEEEILHDIDLNFCLNRICGGAIDNIYKKVEASGFISNKAKVMASFSEKEEEWLKCFDIEIYYFDYRKKKVRCIISYDINDCTYLNINFGYDKEQFAFRTMYSLKSHRFTKQVVLNETDINFGRTIKKKITMCIGLFCEKKNGQIEELRNRMKCVK